MLQRFHFLLLGSLLWATALTAWAGLNSYKGIYVGTIYTADADEGDRVYACPARITVFPDGHSIIITKQLRQTILTTVIQGSFNGNLFSGATRGRINLLNYNYGSYYWIRFIGKEARVTGGPINPIPTAVSPTATTIFRRERS
jgi:hypothetical protein